MDTFNLKNVFPNTLNFSEPCHPGGPGGEQEGQCGGEGGEEGVQEQDQDPGPTRPHNQGHEVSNVFSNEI